MDIIVYPLLLIQICGMVAGQLLTKQGIEKIGEFSVKTLPQAATSPWLWSGALVYVSATLLWFWILSRGNFTQLVPLQSLSMVLAVIFGAVIFKEDVTMLRWTGIIIMSIGALLVAK